MGGFDIGVFIGLILVLGAAWRVGFAGNPFNILQPMLTFVAVMVGLAFIHHLYVSFIRGF